MHTTKLAIPRGSRSFTSRLTKGSRMSAVKTAIVAVINTMRAQ